MKRTLRKAKRILSFLAVLAMAVSLCMAGALAAERTGIEAYILVDSDGNYIKFDRVALSTQLALEASGAGTGALLALYRDMTAAGYTEPEPNVNPVVYVLSDGVCVSKSALQSAYILAMDELGEDATQEEIAQAIAAVYATAPPALIGEAVYTADSETGEISEKPAYVVTGDGTLGEKEPGSEVDEAVEAVIAQISALDPESADFADSVAAAREAYDALNEMQQAAVTNIETLLEAEQILEDDTTTGDETAFTVRTATGMAPPFQTTLYVKIAGVETTAQAAEWQVWYNNRLVELTWSEPLGEFWGFIIDDGVSNDDYKSKVELVEPLTLELPDFEVEFEKGVAPAFHTTLIVTVDGVTNATQAAQYKLTYGTIELEWAISDYRAHVPEIPSGTNADYYAGVEIDFAQ